MFQYIKNMTWQWKEYVKNYILKQSGELKEIYRKYSKSDRSKYTKREIERCIQT